MKSFRSPLTFAACAAFLVLVVAPGAGANAPAFGTAAASHASVKLKSCRSSAWYAGRDVRYRATISRQNLAVPQRLRIKFDVYRKLNESSRFRKLKLSGAGGWKSAESLESTAYQRDFGIFDVEASARYRVKVSFAWADPATGSVQAKRTIWSKHCVQKFGLPKLNLVKASSAPVAGSTLLTHTITVENVGKSEAVDVPLGVRVDGAAPVMTVIDSLGKNQSRDFQITTPACENSAAAIFDPLFKLQRPKIVSIRSLAIPTCR